MATRVSTEAPSLTLNYQTQRPIPANEIGRALINLTSSFEAFANRKGRRFRGTTLAIRRLEISSVIADLFAIGEAVKTIYEHRDLLAGFVTHIQDALQVLAGLKPGKIRQVDQRAIEAVYAPIAKDEAVQVNINVKIDGNDNMVVIDPAIVDRIQERKTELKALKDTSLKIDYDAKPLIGFSSPTTPAITGSSPISYGHFGAGRFGTAFNVDGRWFAALEGEGGALNPLEVPSYLSITHGKSYIFSGSFDGKRLVVTSAQQVG